MNNNVLTFADLLFLLPDKDNPDALQKLTYTFTNPNFFLADFTKYPSLLTTDNINLFSQNRHITFEFAYANLSNINILSLGENYSMPIDTIFSHPEINWNYYDVVLRADFDFESNKLNLVSVAERIYHISDLKKIPLAWHLKSMHIDIKTIQDNPQFPWDQTYFSNNRTVTIEFIKSHPEVPWRFDALSFNINVKEIEKNPNLPWNFQEISVNHTLTSEFLIKYIDQDWDWVALSKNKNLNFDKLIGLVPLNWHWRRLSENTSLTKNFVRYYYNYFYTHKVLHNIYQNKIIPFEEILADSFWPDNLYLTSYHPEITADYVLKQESISEISIQNLSANLGLRVPDLQKLLDNNIELDFELLSRNPNLSFNFILKYKDKKWDYDLLSQNHFNYEEQEEIVRRIETKYLRDKKRKIKEILEQYIILDLGKIIRRYM